MRQSKLDFKAKKDPFPKSDQSKELDQPPISCESKITKTDDKEAAIQILKAFDLDSRYGPCIGLSRLERFNRALNLGLNPNQQILQILETYSDPDITESIWNHL